MGDIASGNVSGFENYAYAALSGVVTGAIFSGVSGCSLFTKLGNMNSLLGKVGQSALLGGTGFGVGTLDSMGRQYVRSGTIDYQQALMDGALMGGVAGGGYLLSQFGPVNKLFGKLADTPFIPKLQQLDQKVKQFFDGKRQSIWNYIKGGKYCSFADGMSLADAKRYNLWMSLREEGLDLKKINEILLKNKGFRPDPSTYLNKSYIDNHLSQFDDGATIVMTTKQYEKFVIGKASIGIVDDGTQFVLPKSMCDEIASAARGDISYYEKTLGFDIGHFSNGGGLVRIDIDNLQGLNLRIPSGNEYGANNHWIPGGFTDGAVPEAVTDLIPNNPANVHITQLFE